MTYLPDTNICIYIIKKKPISVLERFALISPLVFREDTNHGAGVSYVSDGNGGFRKKSLVKSQAEAAFLGTKYFSFKGKNGLFTQIQGFIPANHWLRTILWDTKYNASVALLIPLRNFAAHTSKNAKQRAIAAVELTQLGQSGAWLKSKNRFPTILNDLNEIATRIRNQAPY